MLMDYQNTEGLAYFRWIGRLLMDTVGRLLMDTVGRLLMDWHIADKLVYY